MLNKNKIFILIGTAFIIRLVILFQLSGTPVTDLPIADAKTYLTMALSEKDSGIFTTLSTFTNPFYSYFVYIVILIGGIFTKSQVYSVFIAQNAVTCIAIFIFFDTFKNYLGELVTFAAACIISIYSVLIFYDDQVLSVSFINFLNILTIYFLFKYNDLKNAKLLLAAGLFAGLSAITRANFLLFVFPVFIWLYFKTGKKIKNFFKPALFFAAGIIIFISAISVRNYFLTGEFIPISSNYGYNFYVGNNERSNGTYVKPGFITSTSQLYEEKESISEAGRREGHSLTIKQASAYWLGQGLSFIFNNPGKYFSLTAKKVYLFFNRVETVNNLSCYTADEYSSLLKILPADFGILSAFGLLGIYFLFMQKRNAKTSLLLIFILSYFVSALLFWVSSEYRAPLIMIFAALSVYSVSILYNKFREKKYFALTASFGFAIVFVFWSHTTNPLLERYSSPADDYAAFGLEYKTKNMPDEALAMLLKSVSLDSTNSFLYPEIASLYSNKNDFVNAGKYFKMYPALEKIPDSLKTGYLVLEANDRFLKGNYDEAKNLIKRLIIYDTANYTQINNLGSCYLEMDSLELAEKYFSKSISVNGNYANAHFNLGICLMRRHDYKKARDEFLSANNIKPGEPAFLLRIIESSFAINNKKSADEFIKVYTDRFSKNEKMMEELNKIIKK